MNINDASCILCGTPIRWLSGNPKFCGACFEKTTVAERTELTKLQKPYFILGKYLGIKSASISDFDPVIERHIEDFYKYMDQRAKMHRAAIVMAAINSLDGFGLVVSKPIVTRRFWVLRTYRRVIVYVYNWVAVNANYFRL